MNIFSKKIKTCLLIDPGINFLDNHNGLHAVGHFPFGILSIASFLEKKDIPTAVMALDYYITSPSLHPSREILLNNIIGVIQSEIKKNSFKIIGISVSYSIQINFVLELIALIKQIQSNCTIVLGGSHVSFLDKEILKNYPSVDIIVRGEGEWTAYELFNKILKNQSFNGIYGISYKQNNEILCMEQRTLGDMNDLPPINFNKLPRKFFKNQDINLALTRGCRYHCKFCTDRIFWGHTRRFTPIEKVLFEINDLFKNFEIGYINLEDSMLDITEPYFKSLAYKLSVLKEKRIGHLVSRIDLEIKTEDLLLAEKAGFQMIIYGIESASEKVLKLMNKSRSQEAVDRILRHTKKFSIETGAFWIIGHPGDSISESKKTLDFADNLYDNELLDRSRVSRFIPYPGSDFFNNRIKYSIKIIDNNWENWRRHTSNGICQTEDFCDKDIQEAYLSFTRKILEWEMIKSKK